MKTYAVVFADSAEDDLARLAEYIATHGSLRAAESYTHRLREFCQGLDLSPFRGSIWPDGTRRIGFKGSATVVFRVREDEVEILTVAYRGRKLD